MTRTESGTQRRQRELAERLFPGDLDRRSAFLAALNSGSTGRPSLLWVNASPPPDRLPITSPDLPPLLKTLAPWAFSFDQGSRSRDIDSSLQDSYYALDLSSILTASPLLAVRNQLPRCPRIVDLCAAPGGKSVFASLALEPVFLLTNEVVRKRLGILRHNLARCRIRNAFTQAMDPSVMATAAPEAFHVVIVDAPCSGQSLLSRGVSNPGCFHPPVVKGNARRQRAILRAAVKLCAPGSYLLYSTCTFSVEENENNIERLLNETSDFESLAVEHLETWRSSLCSAPCYRFHPHENIGSGGFCALLRRHGTPLDTGYLEPLPGPLTTWPAYE